LTAGRPAPIMHPMTNTPLTVGAILHHSHFGKGKVICCYEDASVGDMVDVHWYVKNEVLDHRVENLSFGLTVIQPPATSHNPWLSLLEET
jgi:hypothetical protein